MTRTVDDVADADRASDTNGFDRLVSYIGSDMGFESSFYNDAYLDRRIGSRMRRTGTDSYRGYLRTLRDDPEERDALLDALSITVTHFFRNPSVWEALREPLRSLTRDRSRVRLWSAPCADGREPYSMAMLALDDPEIDDSSVQITATDINEDALDRARRGVYETTRTTNIESELSPLSAYEPYVDRDESTFEIRPGPKQLTTFERHDLIRDGPRGPFDLVMCRNLLIYIDATYKMPIFETILDSIRDGGYLVIGMTETLPRECADAFSPVDVSNRIYRKES